MADVCCYVDADECPPDVYRRQHRKAAKEHKCDECNRTIAKGNQYEYVTMCYDGKWQQFRTCWFCAALVRDYCGGVQLHGGLSEILSDCLDYDLIYDEFGDDDFGDDDGED